MLGRAVAADIPALMAIRAGVRENRLADPAAVTEADYRHFVATGELLVWREAGAVVGFAAGDRRDGSLWALFVTPAREGRGIGRALLSAAVADLVAAGHRRLTLATGPDTRAERFYRAAGWRVTSRPARGDLRLEFLPGRGGTA
jgi:GNAT superfamily N-acetyltransferase